MHQCGDDDGVTFEPHADVDGYGRDDGSGNVSGLAVNQNRKWDDKAGNHHGPEVGRIFTAHFLEKYGHLQGFVAIKDGNVFAKSEVEP